MYVCFMGKTFFLLANPFNFEWSTRFACPPLSMYALHMPSTLHWCYFSWSEALYYNYDFALQHVGSTTDQLGGVSFNSGIR